MDLSTGGCRHEFDRDLRHGYAAQTVDGEDSKNASRRPGFSGGGSGLCADGSGDPYRSFLLDGLLVDVSPKTVRPDIGDTGPWGGTTSVSSAEWYVWC